MKERNVVVDKSKAFALRIIKLYQLLKPNEKIISSQMLRSGTSIGANVKEAIRGQTRADFYAKMHIALKETAETEYWLRLLVKSELLTNEEGESLLKDCLEIKRVLIYSIVPKFTQITVQKVISVSLQIFWAIGEKR